MVQKKELNPRGVPCALRLGREHGTPTGFCGFSFSHPRWPLRGDRGLPTWNPDGVRSNPTGTKQGQTSFGAPGARRDAGGKSFGRARPPGGPFWGRVSSRAGARHVGESSMGRSQARPGRSRALPETSILLLKMRYEYKNRAARMVAARSIYRNASNLTCEAYDGEPSPARQGPAGSSSQARGPA